MARATSSLGNVVALRVGRPLSSERFLRQPRLTDHRSQVIRGHVVAEVAIRHCDQPTPTIVKPLISTMTGSAVSEKGEAVLL